MIFGITTFRSLKILANKKIWFEKLGEEPEANEAEQGGNTPSTKIQPKQAAPVQESDG